MKLVPADYVSEEDRSLQVVLNTYPKLRHRLIQLLNAYRGLVYRAIEEGERTYSDMADVSISLAKKDHEVTRLGLPLLNTPEDWSAWWNEWRAVKERYPDLPTSAQSQPPTEGTTQ